MIMLHSWIKQIDDYLLIKAQRLTDYVAARWGISQLYLAKTFIATWLTLLYGAAVIMLTNGSYYGVWVGMATYLAWTTGRETVKLFKKVSEGVQKGKLSPNDKRLLDSTRVGFMLFLVSALFLLLWFLNNNPSLLLDFGTVAMSPIFIFSVFLPTFAYYIMSCKPPIIEEA